MAKTKSRRAPALTPEQQEDRLIAEAINLAEERISSGKVSDQVLLHYLKLGSSKGRAENDKLKEEVKLLKAKTENLESQKRVEELYAEAVNAMRTYSGREDDLPEY